MQQYLKSATSKAIAESKAGGGWSSLNTIAEPIQREQTRIITSSMPKITLSVGRDQGYKFQEQIKQARSKTASPLFDILPDKLTSQNLETLEAEGAFESTNLRDHPESPYFSGYRLPQNLMSKNFSVSQLNSMNAKTYTVYDHKLVLIPRAVQWYLDRNIAVYDNGVKVTQIDLSVPIPEIQTKTQTTQSSISLLPLLMIGIVLIGILIIIRRRN